MPTPVTRVGFFRELKHGSADGPSLREAIRDEASDDEEKIVAYLRAGALFIMSPGVVRDALDPQSGVIGDASIRTDGRYAWPEDFAYYVAKYHVRPPAEFLAHMARNRWSVPEGVDPVQLTLSERSAPQESAPPPPPPPLGLPPGLSSEPAPPPPSKVAKKVLGCCLAAFLLVVCCTSSAIWFSIQDTKKVKASGFYPLALKMARENAKTKDALGGDMPEPTMVTGLWKEENGTTKASFDGFVTGPKGEMQLLVEGDCSAVGSWTITTLKLKPQQIGSPEVDLLH